MTDVIDRVVDHDSCYFNSFDAKSSFESVRLKRDQVKYTACRIPKPNGGHKTIANDRLPQGALNSTGTISRIYEEIFSDLYEKAKLGNFVDYFLQSGSDLDKMSH